METTERIRKKVVNNFFGKITNYYEAPVTYNAPVYNNEVRQNATTTAGKAQRTGQEMKRTVNITGRPMADELASCFKKEVDAVACIERMRPYIVGEKGKQVVLVLKAAYRLEWFEKMPIFPQLVREYGELGSSSGFGEQMKNGFFSDDEIKLMAEKLMA